MIGVKTMVLGEKYWAQLQIQQDRCGFTAEDLQATSQMRGSVHGKLLTGAIKGREILAKPS